MLTLYSQNTTMLYYKVLYNVSTTCFGHYLAIFRLYLAYRVTVLHNQHIWWGTIVGTLYNTQ